ncbi:hypothetical protein EBN88_07365, partial [Streptomyces triticirhizae]
MTPEPEFAPAAPAAAPVTLWPLSAPGPASLRRHAAALTGLVEGLDEPATRRHPTAVARALARVDAGGPHRAAVVARDGADLLRGL